MMACAFKRRVLLLGSSGMVGHGLLAEFATSAEVEVLVTQRSNAGAPNYLDAESTPLDVVRSLVVTLVLHYVINCIGIVNLLVDPRICRSMSTAISVNALVPDRLAKATKGLVEG